jgi:ABC-type sugar transport system ATPase subunit
MNVLDAMLTQINEKIFADFGLFKIVLPNDWSSSASVRDYIGNKVRIGIRPEHIFLSDSLDEKHPISAVLQAFEPTGPENLYSLKFGPNLITTRTSTTESKRLSKVEGSHLAIGFDLRWLYMFDPLDGHTIAYATASSN